VAGAIALTRPGHPRSTWALSVARLRLHTRRST
jgi:hypothetical protein